MKHTDSAPPTEPALSPVRFNAVKHGILSVSPVIHHFESEDDWIDFRDTIFQAIQPRDGLETAFTDRVAHLFWRLMRGVRYEREVINAAIASIPRDMALARSVTGQEQPARMTKELKKEMDRWGLARLLPADAELNKLLRYETRLHRYLLQTLHQLNSLRAGPAPKRVRNDIIDTDIRRIGVRSPRLPPPAPHH
jgi:hypothetical protein